MTNTFTSLLMVGLCLAFSTLFAQDAPNLPKPRIQVSETQTRNALQSYKLSAESFQGKELQYQWYKNKKLLPKATESSYVATKSGLYSVRISSELGEVTSKPVEVKIEKPTPSATDTKAARVALVGCDIYEPNNSYSSATTITGSSATLTGMCFEVSSDDDWFVWNINGRTYYIKAYTYNHAQTGAYTATFSSTSTSFTVTLSSYNGSSIDTYLEVYDSNGTSLIDADDDGGTGLFSEIYMSTNYSITAFNLTQSTVCDGGRFYMHGYDNGTYGNTNTFTIQLSDQFGNFTSPTNLGTFTSTYYYERQYMLPAGLVASSNYRLRIVSSVPAVVSNAINITTTNNVLSVSTTPSGSVSFCPGDSLLLTAYNSYNNYQWTESGYDLYGNNTAQYYAKYTGTYSARATANGCTNYSPEVNVSTYYKPNLYFTATSSSISSGQSTTINISGCSGYTFNGYWKYIDNSQSGTFSTTSFTHTPAKSAFYYGVCSTPNSCKSDTLGMVVTVDEPCDILETNNTSTTATQIGGNNYASPRICLDSGTDIDWFKWTYGGKDYYIKVIPYSSSSVLGAYQLKITLTGGLLVIETLPFLYTRLDTKLYLYDSDGITELAYNDDGPIAVWSKISYTSSLLNCKAAISINHPISNGTSKYTAINSIVANNVVSTNAKTDYVSKAIELTPGFQAMQGTVFRAYVGGCQ